VKANAVLAAVALVMVLAFCGCSQTQDSGLHHDNAEFIEWMRNDVTTHGTMADELMGAVDSSAWYSVTIAAIKGEGQIEFHSMPECDSFAVSGEYIPIKDEYYAYLCDEKLFFSYMKEVGQVKAGVVTGNATDSAVQAGDFLQKATAHLQRVNELARIP
jgi:hypothetical protein